MRTLSMLLIFCFLVQLAPTKALGQASYNQGTGQSIAGSSDSFVGNAIDEGKYMLGPGDKLSINLIIADNDMSLDHGLTIDPVGKIFFPKIGEINLLGLTIPEARTLINSRIRKEFKEQYDFSFRLLEPRPIRIYLTGTEDKPLYMGSDKFVYVYGEVTKRGRFKYLPGKKFSDYISYAGGPLARANMQAVTITRQNQKIQINGFDVIFNGHRAKDIEIFPGDVINVPGNFFYFSDFASFASTVFTAVALYQLFIR